MSDSIYLETSAFKIIKYFANLCSTYNKKIILTSETKAGKTSLVQNMVQNLSKFNNNRVLYMKMTSGIYLYLKLFKEIFNKDINVLQ